VDIEVDNDHRIYGDDWYRFLGSCRATLGTESGANVFDFDGALAALAARNAAMPYEEFKKRFLLDHEGRVHMNQVSPKIFEAIGLRTALILFEGTYSGIVQPHVHFIPLKKDYSNIEHVFKLVADDKFISELTDRAYRDVFASGRYSYAQFIAGVDEAIDRRTQGRRSTRIATIPVAVSHGGSRSFMPVAEFHPGIQCISNVVLGPQFTREKMAQLVAHAGMGRRRSTVGSLTHRVAQVGRCGGIAGYIQAQTSKARAGNPGIMFGMMRWVWRSLPMRLRSRIMKRLG
jgi:hypothetical protein